MLNNIQLLITNWQLRVQYMPSVWEIWFNFQQWIDESITITITNPSCKTSAYRRKYLFCPLLVMQ